MIVDNCTAHPKVDNLQAIKLVFYPPNTTSELQPWDQGIIQNLKCHYSHRMLEKKFFEVNCKQKTSSAKKMPKSGIHSWHNVVSNNKPGEILYRKRACQHCLYAEHDQCLNTVSVNPFELKVIESTSSPQPSTRQNAARAEAGIKRLDGIKIIVGSCSEMWLITLIACVNN